MHYNDTAMCLWTEFVPYFLVKKTVCCLYNALRLSDMDIFGIALGVVDF